MLHQTDGEAHVDGDHEESISMDEFRRLLGENMKHKWKEILYNEGDIGNHMCIIDSGIKV